MLFRERQLMSSFKPGDWVHIPSLNTKPVQYRSDLCHLGLERWQPEVGEWCWFWNKCMDIAQSPRLAQFHLIVEELQKPMDFPAFYQIKYKATKLGYLYDFCEPFIGQLPTHLKDQS